MRDLNYELKQLCRRNRDGSFATQRDRERVLDLRRINMPERCGENPTLHLQGSMRGGCRISTHEAQRLTA
jgi:hypothetical protein